MANIIIADNQDITRAGMIYVLSKMNGVSCKLATDKIELMYQLKENPESVVIVDYTLFDFSSDADLLIIGQRFPAARLVLWSEDLSLDFVRRIINSDSRVSVLLKDSKMSEIRQCIDYAMQGHRFLCQHVTEMLLAPAATQERELVRLTKTETEVLKDIASGMTTREIAERRFSSFHTVNTHRKNIFRKLGVNSVHEATRYAIRAGLVDAAEYYI
ncbi:MAG: response regulator transcription factor [Prevotella sp.]|nr:response regulator transcription factor [Prevotella sp.]